MGPVEFSSEAREAFKRQLEAREPPAKGVRLGVQGGACSGLRYIIRFEDDEPRATDIVWQEDGVNFFIDPKSLTYLRGVRIVWTKTMMKQGFDFENPHEVSRCGCGASFSV